MSEGLKKRIRQARPKLKEVAPHSFWFLLLMAGFNITFGVSLALAIDKERITSSLLIVNDYLTYEFWGIIFIVLGLTKIAAVVFNQWRLARVTLMAGVTIKAAWMVALAIRFLVSPGTILVAALWGTIALAQMLCYIFFLPPTEMRFFNGKKMNP